MLRAVMIAGSNAFFLSEGGAADLRFYFGRVASRSAVLAEFVETRLIDSRGVDFGAWWCHAALDSDAAHPWKSCSVNPRALPECGVA